MMTNEINDDKNNIDQNTNEENSAKENIVENINIDEDLNIEEDEQPIAEELIEKLVEENTDLKDRLMRALAETENIRRRSEKDRQDQAKFGDSPLARELIPVDDNLRRALAAQPTDAMENNDSVKNFVIGIEMTEKQLLGAFNKSKIETIDPKGEKFSYKLHQAMSELENTGQPAGTIVEVIAAGYILNDRLLRPAMVIVAKGNTTKPDPDNMEHVDTTV